VVDRIIQVTWGIKLSIESVQMARLTLKTSWERIQVLAYPRFLRKAFTDINTMFTELYAGTGGGGASELVVTYPVTLHASKLIHTLFTANRAYTVSSIDFTPDIAQGGALTGTVVKAVGTAAPAAATTPMHAANAINFNGTAHTAQSITLTATLPNLALVAGDRIGLVLSAALTVGSGNVTIKLLKA
jgi:hypothetical protein